MSQPRYSTIDVVVCVFLRSSGRPRTCLALLDCAIGGCLIAFILRLNSAPSSSPLVFQCSETHAIIKKLSNINVSLAASQDRGKS